MSYIYIYKYTYILYTYIPNNSASLETAFARQNQLGSSCSLNLDEQKAPNNTMFMALVPSDIWYKSTDS